VTIAGGVLFPASDGKSEATAFEDEAALIDAYPGAMNLVSGRASDARGVMHVNQIIEQQVVEHQVIEQRDAPAAERRTGSAAGDGRS